MAEDSSSSSTDGLDLMIRKLPQELSDMIFSFTLQTPAIITITKFRVDRVGAIYDKPSYTPPLGLRLNREIRARFASEYYSTTIFEFLSECLTKNPRDVEGYKLNPILHWLRSLSPEHRGAIRFLQYTEINHLCTVRRQRQQEVGYWKSMGHHLRTFLEPVERDDMMRAEIVLAAIVLDPWKKVPSIRRIERYDIDGGILEEEDLKPTREMHSRLIPAGEYDDKDERGWRMGSRSGGRRGMAAVSGTPSGGTMRRP